MKRINSGIVSLALTFLVGSTVLGPLSLANDIRDLNQHFNEPGADISPWMFVPQENIKELSTTEHPGLATIWMAGTGKDIKGILKDAIEISSYRLPWEFQLSFVQAYNAIAGCGREAQINYAIGLNVAVTFSDPSTWPTERTKWPADTHSIQLLVVHLGSTGESGTGLPQYSSVPHPDTYLVWGRGDMDHRVMGDWGIPYIWGGSGAESWGPASDQLYFRCRVINPTTLQIGIKFATDKGGWNMRNVDCSEFGRITGIWEIGPIISGDRWIPDVLCRYLPQIKGPHPLMLGDDPKGERKKWISVYAPKPAPPNPRYEYYIDYCVFLDSRPLPFERYSDDFNIPGYMGQWQVQAQSALADTFHNPGYLTLVLLGTDIGTGFCPVGGSTIDLSYYKPPWEIEICFIAPDDTIPWNLYLNWIVFDKNGKRLGMWTPGVQNYPQEKKHGLFAHGKVRIEFEKEIPESILAHKPLYMLVQCIDVAHLRMGFRADPNDPWFLSKVYDASEKLDAEIGKFSMHCWSTNSGRTWGSLPGGPIYQRFLIDYVHYRYGLSTD